MQIPEMFSTLLRGARGVVAEALGVLGLLIIAILIAVVATVIF